MSKKISSISINGLRVSLHSNDESFVCFYIKKRKNQCFIENPKDLESLGNWLINAAHTMKDKK